MLTRLPGSARVVPTDAARVLSSTFSAPVWMRHRTLARATDEVAAVGIAGGATYDAWVALATCDTPARPSPVVTSELRRRLGVDVEMIDA